MRIFPEKLLQLINDVSKLPGIGPRMAERIALFILKRGEPGNGQLLSSIQGISSLEFCPECHSVSDSGPCAVCSDSSRDRSLICVVESPEDVVSVERTGKFRGVYHVLHGLINPMNGVMEENLKIKELAQRAAGAKEIIVAIDHSVEGDATALCVARALRLNGAEVKITRLAKGLPTGSDISYADEITLGQAIVERKDI